MQAVRPLFLVLTLLTFSAALSGCNKPLSSYPQVSDQELKAEESEQHRMLSEMAEQGGAPRPWRKRKGSLKQFETAADKIETAGAALCQELGLPRFDMRCYYYFETSRARSINAVADGERIIIYNGMLKFVENEHELALILSHELAHNLMGHIHDLENNAMMGLLIGSALEGAASAATGYRQSGLAEDAATIGASSYSGDYEREADYIGLYIAARAGYDLSKAAQVWRRLTVEEPQAVYASLTHPSNPERFAALQKTISEIHSKKRHKQPLLPEMKPEFTQAQAP